MESQPQNPEFRYNHMFDKTYKQIFFLVLLSLKTRKETDRPTVKHTPYNSNVQSEVRWENRSIDQAHQGLKLYGPKFGKLPANRISRLQRVNKK